MKILRIIVLLCATVCIAADGYAQARLELTSNGDFETGDTTGWEYFPSANSSFDAVTSPAADVYAGTATAQLLNLATGQAAIVKQANIGVGVVEPLQEVIISFWAKGSGNDGGVQFAEFFSELDGGGVSKAEILGSGPLMLTSEYEFYEFTAITGNNVDGGVTLQLNAATGANIGSTSTFFFDNVSVSIENAAIPEPASATLLGAGGLATLLRRRRVSRHTV